MKYLLLFVIVMVGLWVWRNNRRVETTASTKPHGAAQKNSTLKLPTEIVACDVCQVHLPRSEAITGPHGIYCSAAHSQQAGR